MIKKKWLRHWFIFLLLVCSGAVVFLSVFYPYIRWDSITMMQYLIISGSMVCFILVSSLLVALGSWYLWKYNKKTMEFQLTQLLQRKHLFPVASWQDSFLPYTVFDLQDILTALQETLQRLSTQAQYAIQQGQRLDSGETKEEILEAERQRLARELHDSVSQQLFAATMLLSAIDSQADNMNEELQQQIHIVERVISEAQSEMRALLLHLRPVTLEGKSLMRGVEALLKELMTKVHLTIVWDLDAVHLPSSVEDHLFRIMQELISNTLRHAKATRLEVYLKDLSDAVTLRVVDDGVGFDMNQQKTGTYGLTNMKERVENIGGIVKVVSFINQGTVISIRIPKTEWSELHD